MPVDDPPAAAYRAALAAQYTAYKTYHAPEDCPCKDGHDMGDEHRPGGDCRSRACSRCGRQCEGRSHYVGKCLFCYLMLSSTTPLPREVKVACAAAAAVERGRVQSVVEAAVVAVDDVGCVNSYKTRTLSRCDAEPLVAKAKWCAICRLRAVLATYDKEPTP